jgi:predicted nucleotidyltransferase
MENNRVDQFLNDFTGWARAQADILAVALVGSYARNAARPGSDVDLVIIAEKPARYLQDISWVRRFGTVERQRVEHYGPVTSLRAWYQGGLEVEYGLTGESWAAIPLEEGTRRVIASGMRVLFERIPLLSQHAR